MFYDQKPVQMQGQWEVSEDVVQRRVDRNLETALTFESQMFAEHSRQLILVLTLNYQPEYRHLINAETIARDRDHFFNNARRNPLLQRINGIQWKIEEGGKAGLHMHFLIYYDGASRQDISIAESIGEYWVKVVTQGRGDFNNSNRYKERHRTLGYGDATGQIDRSDFDKRAILKDVIAYHTKGGQQVSSRINPHQQMFGVRRI